MISIKNKKYYHKSKIKSDIKITYIFVKNKAFSTSNYILMPNRNNNSSQQEVTRSDENMSPHSSDSSSISSIPPASELDNDELMEELRNIKKIEKLTRNIDSEDGVLGLLKKYGSKRSEEVKEECLNRNLYASDSSESESGSESVSDNSEENSNKNASKEFENEAVNKSEGSSTNKCEGSSTNKKKFEEDEDSSTQVSKKFKQNSSDVTGDTEPFDFCGGDD